MVIRFMWALKKVAWMFLTLKTQMILTLKGMLQLVIAEMLFVPADTPTLQVKMESTWLKLVVLHSQYHSSGSYLYRIQH